jgi:hypothetical protein
LGQNREAIALLCGASEADEVCLKSEGSALQIAQNLAIAREKRRLWEVWEKDIASEESTIEPLKLWRLA